MVGRFVYGKSYRGRADAVALDPYHLPVTPRRYETAKLDGMFGALRDVSPDVPVGAEGHVVFPADRRVATLHWLAIGPREG